MISDTIYELAEDNYVRKQVSCYVDSKYGSNWRHGPLEKGLEKSVRILFTKDSSLTATLLLQQLTNFPKRRREKNTETVLLTEITGSHGTIMPLTFSETW
jgi:hypothetical protein